MTTTPEAIISPISDELQRVDRLMAERLASNLSFIMDLSNYLISAGGKRVRPILVLLSALANGYCAPNDRHRARPIALSAVVEFIHTATLLHDDVVDDATQRRGQKTVKAVWGNSASVLVGDFLYSRAFQILYEINHPTISKDISDATNAISEGEVQQLVSLNQPTLDEATYTEIITRKTATLFKVACRSGAMLSAANADRVETMTQYGRELGLAFQLIDDLIDYSPNTNKARGQDLAEGKLTLPLIYALENGTSQQQALLRVALGHAESVAQVSEILEATGALAYTYRQAKHYAEQARLRLASLAPSPYKNSLDKLCDFVAQRTL